MTHQGFNITAVERDTGLSKDVLRMWERRYGFPAPERDSNGERVYPLDQVERLRVIKRLIDKGFRPGKLLASSDIDLQSMLRPEATDAEITGNFDYQPYLAQLREGQLETLRQGLQQQVARQGLHRFVLDTALPLTIAVGEAWMRGEVRVHEEHAYTEVLKSLLRQSMSNLARGNAPRVLLTTVPDEEHGVGLLMAEVLLTLEGAHCISLGTRTPLLDIVDAASHHAVDCVALSFSSSFPPRQAVQQITELRRLLPIEIELWIGGAGSERLQLPQGIHIGHGAGGPAQLIANWHESKRAVSAT